MVVISIITGVAIALCCIRYFLEKRSILLINIALSLVAIYDLLRVAGVDNAGIYFAMLAIFSSSLQIAGMKLPGKIRWSIAIGISVIAVWFFGEASAPILLAGFVIARFSESTNNVTHLRIGMLACHIIWAYYAVLYDSHLMLITQLIQILMIVFIMFIYKPKARLLLKQ